MSLGMPRRLRHVALIYNATLGYDMKVVAGIAAYLQEHQPWNVYIEENSLKDQRLPALRAVREGPGLPMSRLLWALHDGPELACSGNIALRMAKVAHAARRHSRRERLPRAAGAGSVPDKRHSRARRSGRDRSGQR